MLDSIYCDTYEQRHSLYKEVVKQLTNDDKWYLSHTYEIENIWKGCAFYIENMDINICDTSTEMVWMIINEDYELYYITRGDEE